VSVEWFDGQTIFRGDYSTAAKVRQDTFCVKKSVFYGMTHGKYEVLVQNRRDGYSCKMAQAVLSFWKTEYFKGGELR